MGDMRKIVFFAVMAVSAAVATRAPAVETPHGAFGVECAQCHTPPGRDAWVTIPPVSACAACHPDRIQGGREHAIGIRPGYDTAPLPLGRGRKIACRTCHAVHTPNVAALLRMPQRDLCRVCHKV